MTCCAADIRRGDRWPIAKGVCKLRNQALEVAKDVEKLGGLLRVVRFGHFAVGTLRLEQLVNVNGPMVPAVAFRAAAILLSSWVATSAAFICPRPVPAQVLRVEGFVRHAPSSQKDRWPVWPRPRRWLSRAGAGVTWFLVRAA